MNLSTIDEPLLALIDPRDASPALSFTPGRRLDTALADAARAAADLPARTGVVYLLHFARRYRHAGHYTGWTTNLGARLDEHAAGRGARLLAVITAAGIGWQVARLWPGATRERERALKRQGGAARRCPVCAAARQATGHPRRGTPQTRSNP